MNNHRSAIRQALEHIRRQQSPDGSFANLSGPRANDLSHGIPRRTTFFTSNILACLQDIPEEATDIQRRAIKFLLSQRSERWSFNYWAKSADRRKEPPESPYPPYPDDLDDTFAALSALARYDASIIDGHAYAAVARLLTSREAHEGGPYRTWLVANDAPAAWQDVDPVVNSTIGYFLSLIGVKLPRLEQIIDEAVLKNRLLSPYYPGIIHAVYFISRFYKNTQAGAGAGDALGLSPQTKLRNLARARLLRHNGNDMTVLEHAMAISSLINLGNVHKVEQATMEHFIVRVERDGFPPSAFCIDPAQNGERHYAGASALTAVFCAEALARYDASASRQKDPPRVHDHIRSIARLSCQNLCPDLRAECISQIEKISDSAITGLAYEFHELLSKEGKIIPLEIVEQLSLASLYGWIAYTIYDDILDGESDPTLLPCANFFLRKLTGIYSTLSAEYAGADALFADIMDRTDNANAWEWQDCRIIPLDKERLVLPQALPSFGDHQTLADRSMGHAMGPLMEALIAGHDTDSEIYKNVKLFFQHYLIARQLHDDAHDWVGDLLNGRINSIGVLVIRRFREIHPEINRIFAIKDVLPELQKIFWDEVIDDASAMIALHIADARRERKKCSFLENADFMEDVLRKLGSGASRAINERDQALVFLKDLKGRPKL